MKRFKEKLAGRVAASAAAAFFVFLLLLVVLELSLPACLIIGGLVYPVMLLVLKPVKKIGKTEISFLEDGDLLHQKLKEAEEDYKRLCRAVDGIEEPKLREKGRELIRVAGNILQYLTDNPKKIESLTDILTITRRRQPISWNIISSYRRRIWKLKGRQNWRARPERE